MADVTIPPTPPFNTPSLSIDNWDKESPDSARWDRDSCDRQQASPIFVVGMPRSGTTLISRLLSAHSTICIAPESHLLNYWMPRFSPESMSSSQGFETFWEVFTRSERFGYFELEPAAVLAELTTVNNRATGQAAPVEEDTYKTLFSYLLRQYAQQRGKPRWGEKTPAHYAHIQQLLSWYPGARIIYMVRDPRSVAASMAKVPWGGDNVMAYTLRWRDSIAHLQRWSQEARVCQVRYESLVLAPEETLRAVCDFVEAPFEREMLNPAEAAVPSAELYASAWAASHFTAAAGAVNTQSLRSWEKTLSKDDIALVEYLAKRHMATLGYDRVGGRLGALGKLQAGLYLLGKQVSQAVRKLRPNRKIPSRTWA